MHLALQQFVSAHAEILSVLALAFVVTMRKTLPPPFDRIAALAWFYGWLRDGLLTFVSFKSPAPVPPADPAKAPEVREPHNA